MPITLKHAFSFLFDGSIWKMELYEEAGLLALEWRDSSGNPSFAVLHYPSGKKLADHIRYGDRWWTLAGITANQLILQHYPQPHQGQTQGLVLIDFHQQTVTGEWFNRQFEAVTTEGILIRQVYFPAYFSLMDEQGNILKNRVNLHEVHFIPRTVQTAVLSPEVPLIPLNSYPVVGPYFLLKQDDLDFWAFHEDIDGAYRLNLAITKDHIPETTLVMDQDFKQLQPEVFFMIGRQLFFIRNNKQEFVSYFV